MSDSQPSEDTSDGEVEFVEQLDEGARWELLNAQKDVLLHLHTQTIRFVQIVFTFAGLVFTAVALFGLDTIASVFSLENLRVARETVEFLPWFFMVTLIMVHLLWALGKAVALFMNVVARVAVLGLTVHPIVGSNDQTELEGGISEWILSNRSTLTIAEDKLSNAYASLVWLVTHLLLVIVLYQGIAYQSFLMVIYGIAGSMGAFFWVGVKHTLPSTADQREQLREKTDGERPYRQVWIVFEDLYERSIATTDSRWAARKEFLSHTWYFLLTVPHILFFLTRP